MTDFAQSRHEAQERIAAAERAVVEVAVAWHADAWQTEALVDAVAALLKLRAESDASDV